MNSKNHPSRAGSSASSADQGLSQNEPDWVDGLRSLYDAVVEEDIPDSFKDLLSKLDETS
jgi:hypothetical protein